FAKKLPSPLLSSMETVFGTGVRGGQVRLAVGVKVSDGDRERAAAGWVVAPGLEAAPPLIQKHGDAGRVAIRSRQVRLVIAVHVSDCERSGARAGGVILGPAER